MRIETAAGRRWHAFTLVEIVVVLGIIAMMILILVGALRSRKAPAPQAPLTTPVPVARLAPTPRQAVTPPVSVAPTTPAPIPAAPVLRGGVRNEP